MHRSQIRVKKSAPWPDSMVSSSFVEDRLIIIKMAVKKHFLFFVGVYARCPRWKNSFLGGTQSNSVLKNSNVMHVTQIASNK